MDLWIEQPCCRDLVCVGTTMEQMSTVGPAPGGKPTERGPPVMPMAPSGWTPTGCPTQTEAPSKVPLGC